MLILSCLCIIIINAITINSNSEMNYLCVPSTGPSIYRWLRSDGLFMRFSVDD